MSSDGYLAVINGSLVLLLALVIAVVIYITVYYEDRHPNE